MYLVTTQSLYLCDILPIDGQLYQVIGYAADGYLLDAIDYDDESAAAAREDFDVDAIRQFETAE